MQQTCNWVNTEQLVARGTTATGGTCQQALRGARGGPLGGLAFVDDDAVGQVRRHDEIVLHDERSLLGVHDEALDHLHAVDIIKSNA